MLSLLPKRERFFLVAKRTAQRTGRRHDTTHAERLVAKPGLAVVAYLPKHVLFGITHLMADIVARDHLAHLPGKPLIIALDIHRERLLSVLHRHIHILLLCDLLAVIIAHNAAWLVHQAVLFFYVGVTFGL